jgi:tetratricopeptide (TPR) repeat protein
MAETWQRFHEAGNLAIGRGLYDTAIAEYMRALSIAEKTADYSSQAETLRALAKTYLDLGRTNEARDSITKAKDLDLSYWGEESQVVSDDTFLLAEVLRREGDFTTARKLYEQVLSMRTIFFGAKHDETLLAIVRLIWIALEEGRYAELLQLTYRAAEVYRDIHPEGGFGKAIDLKALLQPYMVKGKYVEGELIYERALQVLRKVLGDRNLDLAEVLSDCSEVMKLANKHLSAWRLSSRSDAMSEIYSLERQADMFIQTENFQAAEVAFRRLLTNLQKRTAPDKTIVNRALTKYAEVVFKLGRATDAELLKRRAHNWQEHNQALDKPLNLLFWL